MSSRPAQVNPVSKNTNKSIHEAQGFPHTHTKRKCQENHSTEQYTTGVMRVCEKLASEVFQAAWSRLCLPSAIQGEAVAGR